MATRLELANSIRALSMDAVQQANSGHPGMPMGMADIAEVLWNDYLSHDPSRPAWPNRDRFVLSNGHGSMLLYSLLHLSGYELGIDDLKQFRQLHSKTPGHPEYDWPAWDKPLSVFRAKVLPAAPHPAPGSIPPGDGELRLARQLQHFLGGLSEDGTRVTILSVRGDVLASTHFEAGASLHQQREVSTALAGAPARVLRRCDADARRGRERFARGRVCCCCGALTRRRGRESSSSAERGKTEKLVYRSVEFRQLQ